MDVTETAMNPMRKRNNKGPVVIAATAPPTAEHREASREGRFAFGGALGLLVLSGIAALAGYGAVALTLAGACVALLVVGLLLHHEGERQRQRPDFSRPRADEKRTQIPSRTFRRH